MKHLRFAAIVILLVSAACREGNLHQTNPTPITISLIPSSAVAGSAALTLTVTGADFVRSSVVNWNGVAHETTFVAATRLTAKIPADDLATPGSSATITVVSPSPGGGTSAAQTFSINNPTPVLASIEPSSTFAGAGALTLTVTGSGFVSATLVNWNGAPRKTIYGSATQLTASIPATDLASSSIANITATSPTPGGGSSEGQRFTVGNPVPAITALLPSSAIAGAEDVTLTVSGTGFVPTSVINWNTTALSTTYVSAAELTAKVPNANLASASLANVTVSSPAPGGGSSAPQTFTINNPAPTLSATINPSSAVAGATGISLTVSGAGFVSTSIVTWNSAPLVTNSTSATQLIAKIPDANLAVAGTASVGVTNPAPGGGSSAPQTFTVNNASPTLSGLTPSATIAGTGPLTLTVTGSGFVATCVVDWNGAPLATNCSNTAELTATVPAGDLATAGTGSVTVVCPAPGGGTSTAQTFTINNPAPTLSGNLDPSTAVAGSIGVVLTVTGTGFVPTSVVDWNGTALKTNTTSATQVTSIIADSDLASPGTASVTVTNPTPGGGTSAPRTFTIQPAVPVLSALSPASAIVGSSDLTLTANGSGFVATSVVQWNGTALTTTFKSATQVTAAVPAANLTSPIAASVTVTTPAPGGGTSGPQIFRVTDDCVVTSDTIWSANKTCGNLTISQGATLRLANAITVTVRNTMLVTGNAKVLVQSANAAVQVSGAWQGAGGTINAANVQIDSGSSLNADGQGFVGSTASGFSLAGTGAGDGGGNSSSGNPSGAGHGGAGGNGASGNGAGGIYGSATAPITLGSGGQGNNGNGRRGGNGGGAIRLIVTGTLTLNGTVSANGGTPDAYGSGGAGGSLYATLGTLTGAGTFNANGSAADRTETVVAGAAEELPSITQRIPHFRGSPGQRPPERPATAVAARAHSARSASSTPPTR